MKYLIILLLLLSSCIVNKTNYTIDYNRPFTPFKILKDNYIDTAYISKGYYTDGRFNIGIGSYVPMTYGYPNIAFTSFWTIEENGKKFGNFPLLKNYVTSKYTLDTIVTPDSSLVKFWTNRFQYQSLEIHQLTYAVDRDFSIVSLNESPKSQFIKTEWVIYNLSNRSRKLTFNYLLDLCLDSNDNPYNYLETKQNKKSLNLVTNRWYNNEFNNIEEEGLTTDLLSDDFKFSTLEFKDVLKHMIADSSYKTNNILIDNANLLVAELEIAPGQSKSISFFYGLKDKTYIKKNHKGLELGISQFNQEEINQVFKTYTFQKSNQTTLNKKEIEDIKNYIKTNEIKYCYIEAFSDAKGSEKENYNLSKSRAVNIQKQLNKIENVKFNIKYYGEEFADKTKEVEGNLLDRKVIIWFIK